MLRDNDRIRIMHMLDAAKEAVEFAEGRKLEDLSADKQLRHSLVHSIEILGEAASCVSTDCLLAYPEVPWRNIVDMRNRLIHGYHDINLTIVWRTVTQELPGLVMSLEEILESERGS